MCRNTHPFRLEFGQFPKAVAATKLAAAEGSFPEVIRAR